MRRNAAVFSAGLFLLSAGCRSLPKQDGASLAILFDLERKLPGAGMNLVRPGVVHAQWIGEGPIFVQVLAIDTRRQDLYFKPILASGRMDGAPENWQPLDRMAREAGALAAFSGDYTRGSLNVSGFTVIDGGVHLAPKPPVRSGILISRENNITFGLYDPALIGGPAYYQAIGGGPVIVKEDRFQWEWDGDMINGEKSIYPSTVLDAPQARSVACILGDEKTFYWIHVEDRAADQSGVTPQRLQSLLESLRCKEAIMMLGGRYAGLSLHGRLLGSSAWKGSPMGNALGLFEHKRP